MVFRSISCSPQFEPTGTSLRRCDGFGNIASEDSIGNEHQNASRPFVWGQVFYDPLQARKHFSVILGINEAMRILPALVIHAQAGH
jgi:hypothetical protein